MQPAATLVRGTLALACSGIESLVPLTAKFILTFTLTGLRVELLVWTGKDVFTFALACRRTQPLVAGTVGVLWALALARAWVEPLKARTAFPLTLTPTCLAVKNLVRIAVTSGSALTATGVGVVPLVGWTPELPWTLTPASVLVEDLPTATGSCWALA